MRLERFRTAKAAEIEALRRQAQTGTLPAPLTAPRPDFAAALLRREPDVPVAVIAEYKRASPSCGPIATAVDPETAARAYAAAGASCISVLTEETFFDGRLDYLARAACAGVPLLRKDFIFDPLQVTATMATPAAALLLIVRLTPDAALLRDLREQAEAAGIAAVVEIFDEAELALARASGARIVQVNNRDLESLATDPSAALRLGRLRDASERWIAASGMSARRDLDDAAAAGYDAVLVGTALMRGGDPGTALRTLLHGAPA